MNHWFYRQSVYPKNYHRYILKSNSTGKKKRPVFLVIIISICLSVAIYLITPIVWRNHSNNTGKILGISSFQLPNIIQTPKIPPQRLPNNDKINIPAKSAILLDVDTKYPLYLKNERAEVPIASLSKIMTALVSLESYKLDDTITVDKKDLNIIGSKIHLFNNEKISVHSLLYGLLVSSGNDSAYVLAANMAISDDHRYDAFVEKMNQKANKLGLYHTKFYDPAGLEDKGHSTAYDLAILSAYALQDPNFAEIVKTAKKDITSNDGKIIHKLTNSNRLIIPEESLYYQPAIGVKTGYTEGAGHCLVAAASNNNHQILSVVLNTNYPSKAESARISKELLQWGYHSYSWP